MQFVGKIARQLETRSVRLTVSMSQLPMEVFFTQWSVTVSCTFGTKLRVGKKKADGRAAGMLFPRTYRSRQRGIIASVNKHQHCRFNFDDRGLGDRRPDDCQAV
jgi:hypothetical protein